MEKKSKFAQSSSKGATGDSKKSQDVVTNKIFPRSTRKREPTSSSNNFSKNDQARKPGAQKTKNFDKRPKAKGYYHGFSKDDPKVEETDVAELGSVLVPGSKKQNLNHLLNFHYAPRDVQVRGYSHGRNNANHNSNRWLPPVQRHKYNKEQFLQANCQFIVPATGDYGIYLNNPDTLVDWKFVEQIRVHTSGNLSCPICLCPPVAGKMTRCGHVYCWACMLHYLALSDKSWRKCPICDESVHKSDLKSVIEISQNTANIGDEMVLHLMRREKGSLIATEVLDLETSSPTTFFTVSEKQNRRGYSKLLLANVQDILDIIECERVHLKLEKMEDPQSPESCFIDQALEELLLREKQLVDSVALNSSKPSNIEDMEKETATSKNQDKLQDKAAMMQEPDNNAKSTSVVQEIKETVNLESSTDPPISPNGQKFFYFYQADDGQHVYLHAMNVKMLEMQYGSLDQCPRKISGKLLEKEASSFTEDLRHRMRYLWHLPVTCPFEIAEIEFNSPLVSDEVLNHFQEQVETRGKWRYRRERDERKREKKITEEENKRMGKYPGPKVHMESHHHFPEWQPELQSAEVNIPSPPDSESSVASSPSTSELYGVTFSAEELSASQCGNDHGPSFAQMLRGNGMQVRSSTAWPSIGGLPKSKSITFAETKRTNDSKTPEEESNSPPSYKQSFGDAFAQALEQSELLRAGEKMEQAAKGRKKKKPKATVLISTAMARES